MNSESTNTALLPSGFEDLLPPQAEVEYAAISSLMQVFSSFGYERVKPPMAEFEESLLAPGPGAALAKETFRVMDTLTHRMMGLRSDITAQIARIALSRLGDAPRPLRLTYANDVIRTRGSQARTQRQFTQVGCEIIGSDARSSDVEICLMALKGLDAIGLSSITIDFALPQITEELFKVTNSEDSDALRLQFAGPIDKALSALEDVELSAEGQSALERIKNVYAGLQDALGAYGLSDINMTLDPLEVRGFEYHKGLAFTLFASGLRGELGRGGRYDIYDGESVSESAAGFTLYMDTIRHGLDVAPGKNVKKVSADTEWSEIKALQDQGFIVKRG